MKNYSQVPTDDLHTMADTLSPILKDVAANGHIFLTGGTGFIGKWLLAALAVATNNSCQISVLTRSIAGFFDAHPEYKGHTKFQFIEGDIRHLEPTSVTGITHIIHAATPASATLNLQSPNEMLDIILTGTRRIAALASANPVEKLLFLSSGAVYGPQPVSLPRISESYSGAPNPMMSSSAYGEGKRISELIFSITARQRKFDFVSARGFAFLGPHLPIDGTFAAGNFCRDAIQKKRVVVEGDGTPLRSYLYPTDLIHALTLLMMRGKSGEAYNVGSKEGLSIRQLAETVTMIAGLRLPPEIKQTPDPTVLPSRYVPDTTKIESAFDFAPTTSLEVSIQNTLNWLRPRLQ